LSADVTAAQGGGAEGRGENQLRTANSTPSCGKAAAVALYLHNILPLERVAAMFARNPAWRSA
jgi:hypothetical protein